MKRQLLCSASRLGGVPLGTALMLFPPMQASRANPQGGQVISGQASISAPNGATLDIKQSSQRAVIDWRSFSIGAGETTQFQQPNAQAVTLNRVTGSDLSTIAGRLRANGQVVLVNQSGIVFSEGSQVDTGGLIATTTDISNTNFSAGHLTFNRPSPKSHAAVVNRGRITVAQAGLAALVSPSVANSGVISANLGRVVLAGAKTFTADLYGDGLVAFDITSRVTEGAGGAGLVSNSGQITADGGHILLTAEAVDGIIGDLVDAGGTIQARSVARATGTIDIEGHGQGVVAVSGALDASGRGAGQRGGAVSLLGDRVGLLSGASIDVSGEAGGGTALIGGNFHGGGTQQRARVTYVAPSARIAADALGQGNGGRVAIWSDQQTAFYGSISARGGVVSGDGGQIEVSGKNLDFTGIVDRTAAHGRAGTLLLDPAAVLIDNNTDSANDDGKLPTILATDDPGVTDHILASAIVAALGSGNVSIAATGSITVNSTIDYEGTLASSLTLRAPVIDLGADVRLPSGAVTLSGATQVDVFSFTGGNPSLTINAAHVDVGAISNVGTSSSGLVISSASTAPNAIMLRGDITGFGSVELDGPAQAASPTGSLLISAGNSIITDAGVTAPGQTVTVLQAPLIDLGGDVAGGGSLTLDGVVELRSLQDTLTLSAGDNVTVTGEIFDEGQPPNSLAINAPSITLGGDEIGVFGQTVTLNGAVTLTNPESLSIFADRVVATGQITSSNDLTISATSASLSGFVTDSFTYEGTEGGANLTLNTGSYAVTGTTALAFDGTVTTAGSLTLGPGATTFDEIVLQADTTIDTRSAGGAVSIFSADATTAYGQTLSVLSTGTTGITVSTIGTITPLRAFSTTGFTAFGNGQLPAQIDAHDVSIANQSEIASSTGITTDATGSIALAYIVSTATTGLTLDAGTGGVTLNGMSVEDLSIASTGPVRLNGPFYNIVGSPGGYAFGKVTTSGPIAFLQPTSFGSVTLAADTVFSGFAGRSISFTLAALDGTGAGGQSASFSGGTITGLTLGPVGQASPLGALSIGIVGTTSLAADIAAATVGISSPAVLTGPVTVDAPSGASFGTVDGVGGTAALRFTADTGDVSLGTVGGGTRLASLEDASTLGTVTLGGNVSVSQDLSLAGPVALAGDTTIVAGTFAAPGTIALGPVSGAGLGLALLPNDGNVSLAGFDVGSFALSTAGTVSLHAGGYVSGTGSLVFGDVTTDGALTLGQPTSFGTITLATDTTLDSSAVNGLLTLAQVSGPDFTLGLSTGAGGVDLSGVAASGLVVAGSGPTLLRSGTYAIGMPAAGGGLTPYSFGSVTTQGTLAFGQPTTFGSVTLAAPTVMDSSTGGYALDLGPIAGAFSLGLDSGTGDITLHGFAVGSLSATTSGVETLDGGTYALTGGGPLGFGNVTTSGSLVLPQATTFGRVTLAADTTLDMSTAASLALGQASGPATLTVIGGDVTFAGLATQGFVSDITGTETLTAGTYGLGGGSYTFGNVATSGDLIFEQPTSFGTVTLAADTTLDSSGVGGALLLGHVAGAQSVLTLDPGSGTVTLNGVTLRDLIDNASPLATILQTGTYAPAGTGSYDWGDVQVAGQLTFVKSVTRFGRLDLRTGSAIDVSGGSLTATSIDSSGAPQNLTLSNGTYALGPVGQTASLGTLAIDSGQVALSGNVAAQRMRADANTNLLLESPIVVRAPGGAVLPDITGDQPGAGITFTADTGAVSLGQVQLLGVGGTLAALSPTAVVTLGDDIFARSVDLAGPLSVAGSIAIQTTGPVALGQVSGGGTLAVQAGTSAIALSGFELASFTETTTGLATLSGGTYALSGGGPLDFGDVATRGSLVLPQATDFGRVTLAADTTLDMSTAAPLSLGQASGPATLTVIGGDVTFAGLTTQGFVSDITGTETLTTGTYGLAGGSYAFGNVVAGGDLIFEQPTSFGTVTLAGDTTLDSSGVGGALTLGPVAGARSILTLDPGTGTVTLNGLVVRDLIDNAAPLATILQTGTYAPTTGTASYDWGDVQTAGQLTFESATTIFGRLALRANSAISLGGASSSLQIGSINSPGAANNLTLAGRSGTIGPIGQTGGLGTLAIDLEQIRLSGNITAQRFTTGAGTGVLLESPITVRAPEGAALSDVAGDQPGAGLTFTTDTGAVTLAQVDLLGAGGTLAALSTTAPVTLDGPVSAQAVELAGPVSVAGSVAIQTAGPVALGQISGGGTLAIDAGTGAIALSGFELGSFSETTTGLTALRGGTYALSGGGPLVFGNVTTQGTLVLPQETDFGRVTLTANTTLDMTTAAPLALGQASGPATLTVIGGDVTFGGLTTQGFVSDVTGTETLTAGTYGLGGGTYAFGNVVTRGDLVFEQPTSFASVLLSGDTMLDSSGVNGALTLGPASGAFALAIDAGSGAVSLSGVDAATLKLASTGVVTLNGGDYTLGSGTFALGDVTTGGDLFFGQPTSLGRLTLATDTALNTDGTHPLVIGGAAGDGFALDIVTGQGNPTGASFTATGPIDGVGSLTIAGGPVLLDAAVGAVAPVGSVLIDTVGNLSITQALSASGSVSLSAPTGTSDLSVSGAVRSLDGDVTLLAGGNISVPGTVGAAGMLTLDGAAVTEASTGQIAAGQLSVTAGGDVSLTGTNTIATVTSVFSNSFTLADQGALTITSGIATQGDIVIDPPGGAITIASGATVNSAAGNVSLDTSGPYDLTIDGAILAAGQPGQGGGTVFLTAGGNIDEQGQGHIQANALTGSAGLTANLDGANTLAVLGSLRAGGNMVVNDTEALAVLGSGEGGREALPKGASAPGQVSAPGTLTLAATGLTIDADADVSAQIVSLGAFSGDLAIDGTVAPSGDAYLLTSGDLALGSAGSVRAGGTLRADADGSIDLAVGGTLAAGGDAWIGLNTSNNPVFQRLGYRMDANVAARSTMRPSSPPAAMWAWPPMPASPSPDRSRRAMIPALG